MKPFPQFQQQFWRQKQGSICTQIMFNTLKDNNIWRDRSKMRNPLQKLKPLALIKISEQILVKQNNIFLPCPICLCLCILDQLISEIDTLLDLSDILRAVFVSISFYPKITNPNCKQIKVAPSTFIRKNCA